MKRAITNAIIFTVNEQDRIIRNGTVIIDGEKITAVGSSEEVKIPEDTDEIIDCKGEMALLPGLIDTHNHSSLMRGVVENQRMVDWLPVYDLEHRACMEEDAYHAARLCYLECLKNGTTTNNGYVPFYGQVCRSSRRTWNQITLCTLCGRCFTIYIL